LKLPWAREVGGLQQKITRLIVLQLFKMVES
jgi:hypothetical protein